ncbi:MAG: DUF971 domain-containing protein [Pyrinomonadaceae bacterium]
MTDFNQQRGPAVQPLEIRQNGDAEILIKWGDEKMSLYRAPQLRLQCPCAQCVNEWTGERMLRPEAIPDNLTIADVDLVGRYALNFKFSDGHTTGIYSFRYLSSLDETSRTV